MLIQKKEEDKGAKLHSIFIYMAITIYNKTN